MTSTLQRYIEMQKDEARYKAANRLHTHLRRHLENDTNLTLRTTIGEAAKVLGSTCETLLDAASVDYWIYVDMDDNKPVNLWTIGLDGE